MASAARAVYSHVISLLLLAALPAVNSASADDLLSFLHPHDAKELQPVEAPAPPPAPAAPSCDAAFLPLPGWAHGAVMPPLPDVLTPMGKKVVLTTPPVPAPAPLTPPKEPAPPTVVVEKPKVVEPPPQNPALIAVSPFLDWVKANPQAAAAQAHQQAAAYESGSDTVSAVAPTAPATPPANGATGPIVVPTPAPYWMPPLIDAAPFGTYNSGNVSGSSAAIYTTPQR